MKRKQIKLLKTQVAELKKLVEISSALRVITVEQFASFERRLNMLVELQQQTLKHLTETKPCQPPKKGRT